jgi:hypothetical protein
VSPARHGSPIGSSGASPLAPVRPCGTPGYAQG